MFKRIGKSERVLDAMSNGGHCYWTMANTLIPMLTFRVIRMPAWPGANVEFQNQRVYVAIAWNYDYGQLMSTKPYMSYTDARSSLDELVTERKCALRWFDGEYEVAGDGAQIVPVDCPSVPDGQEQDRAHKS